MQRVLATDRPAASYSTIACLSVSPLHSTAYCSVTAAAISVRLHRDPRESEGIMTREVVAASLVPIVRRYGCRQRATGPRGGVESVPLNHQK